MGQFQFFGKAFGCFHNEIRFPKNQLGRQKLRSNIELNQEGLVTKKSASSNQCANPRTKIAFNSESFFSIRILIQMVFC